MQEQTTAPAPRGAGASAPQGRCAVIGHPAAHSLSPALHRAAYRQLGLDWSYEAIDVEPGGVADFVKGLDGSWRGISVTMPHKEAIRAHGVGDELVELVGVANTLVIPTDGEPLVRNTDVGGFQLAMAQAGVESADSATIIGNGATARSAAVALRMMGVERLLVLARRPERAEWLREFASHQLGMLSEVRPLVAGQVLPADVLVSTVPDGGSDALADELAASAPVVFDAIYDPWPTVLAAAAERAGARVVSGLDLLAGQAVEQVRLMTGGEVSFELLVSAGQEELRRRAAV